MTIMVMTMVMDPIVAFELIWKMTEVVMVILLKLMVVIVVIKNGQE